MSKTATAIPSMDIEVYKTNSEALNNGQDVVTLTVTAKALLERGLQTEDDYQSAVQLGNRAAAQEDRHKKNFDPLCKLLHGAHKMATGLREQYASPWGKLADALRNAARQWYLEAEKAKKAAEQELLKQAQKQQKNLIEQAQELIDQGFVKRGREVLMQAQATTAPVLPDAVPQVEGARITPKYTGTCTDLMAVLGAIVRGEVDLMWEVRDGELRPLVALDQVVLNAILKRLGNNFKCPGITVERDVQIGATRLS